MRKYQVIFFPLTLVVVLGIASLVSGTIAGDNASALRSDASLGALPSLSGMPLSGTRLLPALWQSSPTISDASHGTDPPGADQTDERPVPRELDFAYYSIRDGFESQLQLVSDYPKPFVFRMMLHSLSGQTAFGGLIRVQPQQKLSFDIGTLLTKLRLDREADFQEGSISISYTLPKSPLLGQVTVSNPSYSLVFESLMGENDPGQTALPPVLDGVWWGLTADREAKVMVTNTSNQPLTADVELSFGGKRHPSHPLVFERHETKILSISELLAKLNLKPEDAPEGGITITGRGSRPVLIAAGMIADWRSGFSTTMHFMLMGMPMSSTLYASGVPIGLPSGGSPFPSADTFVPHVIVRNLLPTPQTAAVTIEYPEANGTQQIPLAPSTISPYSTNDLSLQEVISELPEPVPYCSIRVEYSGAPGSAVVEVSSVDQNQNLVVDSKLGDPNDSMTGSGMNPWHLGDHTEAVLFLTDAGDKPARIGFQIQANGVHYYLTDLKLNPHETRVIDIRKLRDAQKADFKGNKIPPEATDGGVFWIRLDKVPVVGRLLVIDSYKSISSNFDCSCTRHCPLGYYSLTVTPDPPSLFVGESIQFKATEEWGDCNGFLYPYDVTGAADWSSSNFSAVAVSTSGLATAVGGGSAIIVATYADDVPHWSVALEECIDNYINRQDSKTVSVQVPSSLSLSLGPQVTYNGNNVIECNGTNDGQGWGYSRCGTFTLMDQNGVAITRGSFTATESGSKVASNPASIPVHTGGGNLTNGTFQDFWAFVAVTAPPPQPGEFIKVFQRITIRDNESGTAYPDIRINCLDFESNDVTVTDITISGSCQ